jgi:hypothetical protein
VYIFQWYQSSTVRGTSCHLGPFIQTKIRTMLMNSKIAEYIVYV